MFLFYKSGSPSTSTGPSNELITGEQGQHKSVPVPLRNTAGAVEVPSDAAVPNEDNAQEDTPSGRGNHGDLKQKGPMPVSSKEGLSSHQKPRSSTTALRTPVSRQPVQQHDVTEREETPEKAADVPATGIVPTLRTDPVENRGSPIPTPQGRAGAANEAVPGLSISKDHYHNTGRVSSQHEYIDLF